MRTTVLIVAVLILAGTAVGAHHSYADFDQDRSVSVEGTIQSILFANPHVVMMVKKDDSTVYTMTWASATQLTRQGRSDSVFGAGRPSISNSIRTRPALSRK